MTPTSFSDAETRRLYRWMRLGIERGWIVGGCVTHDAPYTDAEFESFEDGDDPCCHVWRVACEGMTADDLEHRRSMN